ncbi:MAG: hypothetical protein ACYC3G_03620 [Minisyncoccota bacterium]
MKIIALAILVFFSFISTNSFANNKDSRGAVYNLDGSVLTITETSFKQINRLNNGEHASMIVQGKIPIISIKEAVEKIQTSHDLFQEKSVMLSPASNLLIEFDGRITNLLMSHICRGENGNYLAVSIPDIYFTENLTINISGQEKIIKQLIISTDPSTGLLLQKKLLWGSVTDYWRFLLKQIDYDKKFKVQGLINYAEQRSENNEIEKLELTIIIIKISPLP